MERLDNSSWGVESNCFVCEEANPAGLGIPFFVDHDHAVVTASFVLDDRFSGAPTYVHGGVVQAVLDEAMAWATIALAGCFAVTKEITVKFRAPVIVGHPYVVRARIDRDERTLLECSAEIFDEASSRCAEASATFASLGPAQAAEAAGAEIDLTDRDFVREP